MWEVAAKGEDVLDVVGLVVLDDGGDFVAGVRDAGEVGHGLDVEVVADGLDPVSSRPSGRSAGAVGDGHELGTVSGEAGEGPGQAFGPGVFAGRGEFEGQRLARIKQLRDAGHSHSPSFPRRRESTREAGTLSLKI